MDDPRATPENTSASPPQAIISGMSGHLPQRNLRTAIAVCIAFAFTPVATLGYGTPLLFSFAALRRREHGTWPTALLWISACIYAVVLTIGVTAGGLSTAPTTADRLHNVCLLITIGVGSLHALGFVIWSAVTRSWPVASPDHQQETGIRSIDTPPSRQRHLRSQQRQQTALVLCLGAFLAYGFPNGVGMIVESRSFASHHQVTDGVVTDVRKYFPSTGTGTSWTASYATTVEYRAPDGRQLRFQDDLPDRPRIGTHLRVYYDAADPSDARLDKGSDELVDGIFLLTASMVLLFFIVVVSRRKPHR